MEKVHLRDRYHTIYKAPASYRVKHAPSSLESTLMGQDLLMLTFISILKLQGDMLG